MLPIGQLQRLEKDFRERRATSPVRPSPPDARYVKTFLNLHAPLARRGYVVCRCPRKQQLTPRLTALPWNEF